MNMPVQNIIKKMKENRVSQRDLAKMINVSQVTVNAILNSKTSMKVSLLQKIADAFDVPIIYFFDDNISQVLSENNVTINEYYSENSKLKKELEDKEMLILFLKEREYINQITFIEISKILNSNKKKIDIKILKKIKKLVKIKSLIEHKIIQDFTK